jgi:phage terminase large subunit-like protein
MNYAEDVTSGKIPACVYVRQACERQLTDLERRDFPYYFDAEAGEAICRYMERLPHVMGEPKRADSP